MKRILKQLIIVLPVYEDRESLKQLLRDIASLQMPFIKLLIVDDGSVRTPPHRIDLIDAGFAGEVIRLRCNVGHQMAIAMGLNHINRKFSGCPVLVMDADGEDRPDTIPKLIRCYEEGDADIVVATRGNRFGSLMFRLCCRLYTVLFRLLTGRAIQFGNFALLSSTAVRRLAEMPELPIHFAASVLSSRLRLAFVSVDRGHRYAGASKMDLMSLSAHGMRSMLIFSNVIFFRGGLSISFSLIACLVAILLAPNMTPASMASLGWSLLTWGLLIITFLQATALAFLSMMKLGFAGAARQGRRTLSANEMVEQVESVQIVGASITSL